MAAAKLVGGHEGSVLTLSYQEKSKTLASGGENGVLCLWSDDGRQSDKLKKSGSDCNSVCFSKDNPNLLYAAFGEEILLLDTRQLQEPVFVFKSNQDEVNQVVLDGKEEFLAACDDCGEIKVYGLRDKKVFKTLRFKHTNICSTTLFRPNRHWELLSGGLDCRLVQWDFSKPKCLYQINMQELQANSLGDEVYMLNPPFVHHISSSPSGKTFALGLENGRVVIMDGKGKNVQPQYVLNAHRVAVSQVHFLSETGLVSAGNDCCITEWDLSRRDNADVFPSGDDSSNTCSPEERKCLAITEACKMHTFQHSSKINWLTVAGGRDQDEQKCNKMFVADQTPDIAILNVT